MDTKHTEAILSTQNIHKLTINTECNRKQPDKTIFCQ